MDTINFNVIIRALREIKETPDPGPYTERVKNYLRELPAHLLSKKDQKKAQDLIGRTTLFTQKEIISTKNLFEKNQLLTTFLEAHPGIDSTCALNFFEKTTKGPVGISRYTKLLHPLSREDINSLFIQIDPLIPYCNDKQIYHVMEQLLNLPSLSATRSEVCTLATNLLEGIEPEEEESPTLHSQLIIIFTYLYRKETEDFCRQVLPFIKDDSSLSRRISLMNTIAFIQEDKRTDFCKRITLKITTVPPEDRPDLIEKMNRLYKTSPSEFDRECSTTTPPTPSLPQPPPNYTKRLVKAARGVDPHFDRECLRGPTSQPATEEADPQSLIERSSLSPTEKEQLRSASRAANLNFHQMTMALEIISYFAPEDRSTVVHSFKKHTGLRKPFLLVKHLLTEPVLRENTHAFLKTHLTTGLSIEAAEDLAGVLIAKREDFHIAPETSPWKEILRGPLTRIAADSLAIPFEERDLFCEEARYLWPHAPYDHYATHLLNLRQLLQLLPVEQRRTHLSLPLFLSLVSYSEQFERQAPVIKMITLLFKEGDRSTIIEILSHMLNRAPFTTIRAIFESHLPLSLSIPRLLIEKLNTETNPTQAGLLAHFILTQTPYFSSFAQRDILTQTALTTLIATADNRINPKNPYAIFQKLVASAKQPTPPAPYQTGVKLNFKKIFETARTTIPQAEVFAKTHGRPLNGAVLENLIQAFRSRIMSASPSQQEAIEGYVKTSTNFSLTDLLYNLENPFFIELLNKPYQEEVPLQQAMICSLTQLFLDLSNEVPEGDLLSPREEALYKMSASIQNCNQAKSEGLSLTYALLEEKYRYSTESDIDVIKKATAFVRESLQQAIMNQLSSDSPMMHAMLGSEEPARQLAHQSIYLKNLLGPHIGMPHPIQLDPYTGTLKDSLVRRSLKEIFVIFYAYFDVETAKVSLQKAFSQLPEEAKPKIFNGIIELLGTTEDLFELEEVTDKPSLTAKGALQLLLALGIGESAPI